MQFQKGQSGNPAGRPPGRRNPAAMLIQKLIEESAEHILTTVIAQAKEGNLIASKMCLDRVAPVRRSDSVAFELPILQSSEDYVAGMAAIADAVAAGDLTPAEAAHLSRVLAVSLRALAVHRLDKRMATIENEPAAQYDHSR